MDQETLLRFKSYKDNPWKFLTECVFTRDAVDTEQPVKLFPDYDYIRFVVRAWEREKQILVPKSRRMTASWTFIALTLWDVIFHRGREWAFVSKKEDDSMDLVSRAEFIFHKIPPSKIPRVLLPTIRGGRMTKSPPKLEFEFGDSEVSYIAGFPMGADQLRQFTFSGILGDEAAFWPNAEEFYTGAKPTTDGGGRMILVSSRSPGFFKKLVFDQINNKGSNFPEIPPAPVKHPMQGVEVWKNPKNKFLVIDLHYTAHPGKRDASFQQALKDSLPLHQYLREYERNWQTFSGMPVFPNFRRDIHLSKTKLEPHIGLPLLFGWDFGLCYDALTEVLTNSGWKFFKDVDIETDLIASLNPHTFDVDYVKSDLKVDQEYKGDLYYAKGSNLNFAITPDHIVPTWTKAGVFGRYRAEDLLAKPGHKMFRMTGNFPEGTPSTRWDLKPEVYAALMGAYLSEGSACTSKVRIYQLKPHQWLKDILSNTWWQWKSFDQGYEIHNSVMAQEFKQYGKQDIRRIPRDILNGTRTMLRAFLDAYTHGDGHIRIRSNGAEEHTIFTISSGMADDMQELAAKLGWSSSIRKVKPQRSYYAAEDRFIESSEGYSITFKKNISWGEFRSYDYERRHYEGRVYCLRVPHHILYVRRNGKPHWNGNTPACVVAQLQGNSLKVLHEWVSKNEGIKTFAPMVMNQVKALYPEWNNPSKDHHHFIDPAGFSRAQTDMRTCAQEMQESAPIVNLSPGPVAFEKRKQAVEHFLLFIDKNGAGLEINPEGCPTLVEGMAGGYRYADSQSDIESLHPMPIKDMHSHPADAFQYLCDGARNKIDVITYNMDIPSPKYSFIKENTPKGEHSYGRSIKRT